MADTYFTRTPGSAGNRRTFTWSAWLKRSGFGSTNRMWSAGTSIPTNNDNLSSFIFNSDDTMTFFGENSGVQSFQVKTNQVFRDTSAWYHIVLAVDTTQATASNRVKFYVNGSQVTSFSTASYMSQNYDTFFNATNLHVIGYSATAATFNGYMAHVHFTDGTQYAASDFGETDTNGQWKPKTAPSVTYGTNGFFLKFANSGSLGTDSSGNGNNFTKNGSGDQVTDTPDNVFCTLNSVDKDGHTNADGNLKVSGDVVYGMQRGTQGPSSGKWYFEALLQTAQNDTAIGLANENENIYTRFSGETTNSVGYLADGRFFYNSSSTTYSSLTTGDIFQIAFDADTGKIWIGKNNTWQNSGDPAAGTNAVQTVTWNNFIPAARTVTTGVLIYNFGQDSSFTANKTAQNNADDNGYGDFYYSPPTGYLALCTKNLATALSPTIDDGSSHFQTLTFTGNGGTQTLTFEGNSNLQADFMWFKERNLSANWHQLWDTSRGIGVASSKRLYSNATSAEDNITTGGGVRGVGTDTVEVGSTAGINGSSQPIVLWAWKANGGTTSSNTDGSITSTVQADTTAGFSIVTYTGNFTEGATFGHGLGKAPKVVIIKGRTNADNWTVYNGNLSVSKSLYLQSTDAERPVSPYNYWNLYWDETDPNSSVVTLGVDSSVNGNSQNYVAYCFAEIEGYSKFGKYTGNGSSDGTFVYTGFRPAWVMTKGASTAQAWSMRDNKRDSYNSAQKAIYANAPDAESDNANNSIDLLSNGFKIRNLFGTENSSGQTYIYMAFAEHPFVDSTGRPVTAR